MNYCLAIPDLSSPDETQNGPLSGVSNPQLTDAGVMNTEKPRSR